MDMRAFWTYYKVRWDFLPDCKLCASVPASEDLIKKWLENRQPKVRPPGARSIREVAEEVVNSLARDEEEGEVAGLVFQAYGDNGDRSLVVRSATIRAHLKDCSRVISTLYGRIEGEKSFAVKIKNYVYPLEENYWVPILRPNGDPVKQADGTKEQPIHVTDARGRPMNALKLFEYIQPARLDFVLKVMNYPKGGGDKKPAVMTPIIPIEDMETLMMFGGTHGYGGERSNGEGKYTFHIEQIEEPTTVRKPASGLRKGRTSREERV